MENHFKMNEKKKRKTLRMLKKKKKNCDECMFNMVSAIDAGSQSQINYGSSSKKFLAKVLSNIQRPNMNMNMANKQF